MFEVKLKKPYKTCVKHTILNLGYALLNHREAPRTHKPHECHLEGPWGHLGASCGPSGGHLSPSELTMLNNNSSSFSLARRNARSRLNKYVTLCYIVLA